MKQFNLMTVLMPVMVLFSIASCDKKDDYTGGGKEPVITFVGDGGNSAVHVDHYGGSKTIAYTIKNAEEHYELSYECADSWVNGIDLNVPGVVVFNVDSNNGAARTSDVKIKYTSDKFNIELGKFTVMQDAFVRDPITFEMEITNENGIYVLHTVPSNKEVHYAIQHIQSATASSWSPEQLRNELSNAIEKEMARLMEENTGLTKPQVIQEFYEIGDSDNPQTDLAAETSYLFVAVALDDETGEFISDIATYTYETAAVELSDMTIDIRIDELTSRTLRYTITPSKLDEPYFLALTEVHAPTVDWSKLSDEEIFAVLRNPNNGYNLGDMVRTGVIERSEELKMAPETDYIIMAFGFKGNVVTTPLFKKIVTTLPEEIGDGAPTVELVFGKYFKESEFGEKFPSDYVSAMEIVLPVEVKTSSNVDEYVWMCYGGMDGVDLEEYGLFDDEEWITTEILQGRGVSHEPKVMHLLEAANNFYGYHFFAVAYDKDKNIGKLFKTKYTYFPYSGCSSMSEWDSKWNVMLKGTYSASTQALPVGHGVRETDWL